MIYPNRTISNFIYSSLILGLWTVYVLIIFSPRPNIIFKNQVSTEIVDNRFFMFLFTRYFALWSGIVVLLLRLIRIIKNKCSFIYIFIGLLNVSLGVLGVYFSGIKSTNIELLCMFSVNLSIGLIIYIDIFFLSIVFDDYKKNNE